LEEQIISSSNHQNKINKLQDQSQQEPYQTSTSRDQSNEGKKSEQNKK
jgi:hypothetical protein